MADAQLIAGLRIDDPSQTHAHVRERLNELRKNEQRRYVDKILALSRESDQWEVRATAAHMLEAVVDIDQQLITVDVIDELAHDLEFSVRSSAAVMLYLIALSSPGLVPIDLLAHLAKPSTRRLVRLRARPQCAEGTRVDA
ncbi:MAG: hypothetical protein ACREXY_06760 [Gammaproteobacteria bacterium]